AKGELWGGEREINFGPNVHEIQLYDRKEPGAGGRNVNFELAGNVMGSHISEFPVGTYKKAHRHGPGAHVIIIGGQGYSLIWPQGAPINRLCLRVSRLL